MEHILAYLVDSVDEISGAYLYRLGEPISCNHMPDEFDWERLDHIGQQMVRNLSLCKACFDDIVEVSIHYMESNITAKEVQEHGLLIVMFNPSINKMKLHMSLELALESLAEGDRGVD